MKQSIKTLASTAIKTLGKHSPTILAGIAVAGVITTGVLAAIGHTKAKKVLTDLKQAKRDDAWDSFKDKFGEVTITDSSDDDTLDKWLEKEGTVTKTEKIKATWLCYLPAGVSAILTIAAIIASNSINQKRLAAMSILLSSAETALSNYDKKAAEILGRGKADKIKSAAELDTVPDKLPEDGAIERTGHGDTLFMDKVTGRLFRSSMEYILQQQNDFNTDLLRDGGGDANLNDWYYVLDLGSSKLGDLVGFTASVPLKLEFNTAQLPEGQQITLMSYQVHPNWDDRSRATLF